MIKKFKCGLCRPEKRIWMARHSLRKHLGEEHLKHNFANTSGRRGKLERQRWWIWEEFK